MASSQRIADRFVINDLEKDLLGRGGMADVYRAADTQTGEPVAIKVLRPQPVALDPDILERFVREGQALRQLNHPNIVGMVAAVEQEGQHYLVMEYVGGGSLKDLLDAQGPLPGMRVVELALDLADALARAHRLGIIHRDLKPSNVLLAEDGTPRLSDFGIAHVADSPGLTDTGILIGTVDYLSPEACQGEPLDEQTDLWALGLLLYEMLTGERPFRGATLAAKLTSIVTQPLPDLSRLVPGIPYALVNLICRMLEKDRRRRIASVRLVGAELEAIWKGREITAPTQVAPAERRLGESLPPSDRRRHNLPTQATPFIGREGETAEVRQRLLHPETRLLTLTGPGGTGKTRLGLQAAAKLVNEFADGVFFVSLAPISDPALVAAAIAQALGLRDVGQSPRAVLKDYLREKHLLLLLDNFEHVAEAAPVVSDLLAAAPLLKLLVTSRAVLNVYGEHVCPVPPMALPDPEHLPPLEQLSRCEAVRLFAERTLAVRPDFALTDGNAAAVANICRRVDGLPLAIELAAARGKVLSPQALLARLERRLPLLTGGARDTTGRQQTLRNSLAWSYDLLGESEKTLFQRLAVFVGGCSLEAAERVCRVDGDLPMSVLDGLASLIDNSLLRQDEIGGEPYFTMLETIREYALEQLEASGEWQQARQRHAECFAEMAERAGPELKTPRQMQWLTRLEAAHPNFRAALGWTLDHAPETALRLAGALGPFWSMRNYVDEGLGWLRRVLANDQSAWPAGRARALAEAGGLTWLSGDPAAGRQLLEEGIALYRTLGDSGKQGLADALSTLGITCVFQGDLDAAESASEESVALFRTLEDRAGLALALATLAKTGIGRRDAAAVRAQHEESIALFREVGDKWGLAIPLVNLAILLHLQGEDERAALHAEESVALLAEVGDQGQLAIALVVLAQVRHSLGELAEARARYDEAMDAYRKMGIKSGMAAVLYNSGNVTLAQGDYARAARLFRSSLEICLEENRQVGIARCLSGLAGVAIFQGNATAGVRLLGKAEAMREAALAEATPTERATLDRTVAAARAQLDESAFARTSDEGRSMALEQAVELGLSDWAAVTQE